MNIKVRLLSAALMLFLLLPLLISCDTDDIDVGMQESDIAHGENTNSSFIGGNVQIGGEGFESMEGIISVVVDEDGNIIYIGEDGSVVRVDEDGNVIIEDDGDYDHGKDETEYTPETVILPDGTSAPEENVEILSDGTVMVTSEYGDDYDYAKCYLPDSTYAIVYYYDSEYSLVNREEAYRAHIEYFMENDMPLGTESIRISDRITLTKTEYEYLAEDVTGQGGVDGFIYHHTATVKYFYDDDGNLQNTSRSEYVPLHGSDKPVTYYYYDKDGNLEFYNEYEYYMNGQIEWDCSYHGDGTESYRYHYDENGVMLSWYQFDEEGDPQRKEFYKDGVITSCDAYYDWGYVSTIYTAGRVLHETWYSNDGTKTFHVYDPETENLMRITGYSEDGEIYGYTEYVYRTDNSREKALFYDADGYLGSIEYYNEDGVAVKNDSFYYHMDVIYHTVYYREDGYTYLRVEYFDLDGNPDYIDYYDENGNLIEN